MNTVKICNVRLSDTVKNIVIYERNREMCVEMVWALMDE